MLVCVLFCQLFVSQTKIAKMFFFVAYLLNTMLVVCIYQGLEVPVVSNSLHIKTQADLRHIRSPLIFCLTD